MPRTMDHLLCITFVRTSRSDCRFSKIPKHFCLFLKMSTGRPASRSRRLLTRIDRRCGKFLAVATPRCSADACTARPGRGCAVCPTHNHATAGKVRRAVRAPSPCRRGGQPALRTLVSTCKACKGQSWIGGHCRSVETPPCGAVRGAVVPPPHRCRGRLRVEPSPLRLWWRWWLW